MDFIKARGIWIVTTVIILCGLYYWVVVDEKRELDMSSLEVSDDFIEKIKSDIPELPDEKKKKIN